MRGAIHITGASGSGTTTLGRRLASELGSRHLDTDDFYWEPSDPPYAAKRSIRERLNLLAAAFGSAQDWVLSGSLCGWGDPLATHFGLVVFLSAPTETRLARLKERERERFGTRALAPGGTMHHSHDAFLVWAAGYEDGAASRNRAEHERWLSGLTCPVLRLDGMSSTEDQVHVVVATLARNARDQVP